MTGSLYRGYLLVTVLQEHRYRVVIALLSACKSSVIGMRLQCNHKAIAVQLYALCSLRAVVQPFCRLPCYLFFAALFSAHSGQMPFIT